MKKCNEIIDFLALEHELRANESVSKEQALNAKAFWLRYELFRFYGTKHRDEIDQAYYWISDAPVSEWNGMLVCLTQANCQTLGEAKELYKFLL